MTRLNRHCLSNVAKTGLEKNIYIYIVWKCLDVDI